MALFSNAAHALGMPIAQKNSVELLPLRSTMGTDFAIAEECHHFDECEEYSDVYGSAVLIIEYLEEDFDAGCAAHPERSLILRDLDLVAPGTEGYRYEGC